MKDVYVETPQVNTAPKITSEALAEYRRLYDFINKTEEIRVSVVSALVTSPGCVPASAQWLLG